MNYKNVAKKKKKNTAIIVIASILACALAGGAIAGLGFHFNWWNAEKEAEGPKPVPTSTFNLEIEKIEDLCGVEFKYDDYTRVLSTWQSPVEVLIKEGIIDSAEEEISEYMEVFVQILNVDPYGKDFEVSEAGQYKIAMKINGNEVVADTFTFIEYDPEADSFIPVFQGFLAFDKEGKQIELKIDNEFESQLNDAHQVMQFLIFPAVLTHVDDEVEDVTGFSMMIQNVAQDKDGFALETFEFVSFERIGDIPEGLN